MSTAKELQLFMTKTEEHQGILHFFADTVLCSATSRGLGVFGETL